MRIRGRCRNTARIRPGRTCWLLKKASAVCCTNRLIVSSCSQTRASAECCDLHVYSRVLSPICEVTSSASAVLNTHASIRAVVGAGAGVGVGVGANMAATRQCRRSRQTPASIRKLENDQRRRRGPVADDVLLASARVDRRTKTGTASQWELDMQTALLQYRQPGPELKPPAGSSTSLS